MFRHLGVRGRLFMAFFGISAFAVLAAAAAMYSFSEVGQVLSRITQQRVPTALASLELSRQAERIVAAAPALLTVTTSAQHDEQSSRIAGEDELLGELLSDLKGSAIDASTLEAIEPAVARLRRNLDSLNGLVASRLAISEEKKQLLQALFATHTATQRLLAPWVLVTGSKLSQLRQSTDDPGLAASERIAKLTDLVEAKETRERLQQAQFEASVINDTLLQAASAEQRDLLPILSFRLRRQIGKLGTLAADFDPKLRSLLLARVAEFRDFAEASDGLPESRKKELELAAAGEALLQENAELARRLTEVVDQLVGTANRDIDDANLEALSVQQYSTWILIAVVALSLASSVLIVWLYVGRNLIARLTALSDSMLAIAGGSLKAKLPPTGGDDEIGAMAKALAVFRDTAVEVKETNLREISEARRRLTDAIESISEGFSLYDADDRLVLYNTTYSRLLYPGIEDVLTAGASFETVIRKAAERGLIRDAEGRIEEWVAERIAQHRNPGESHLQHRSDGRWILISERKTGDGGTVAVYADITELKRREEELAEKSAALEQLSNQLSKYLSPQVYESIFSGKQEVKVASSRKKLTVFFSDIEDFTEMADRLESEELTQLLNHYLTEMSQIALDHGATIDKYVGDAILIFFGDPETKGVKEDALACVKMAIAMRKRLHDLEDIWRESGIEKPLQCRMGIHTDYCTVGNFGSEARMDYTIIGGAVNTASRLESLVKPGEILISYETFAHVRDQIQCEDHGETEVKGIAYPIATYQVVDSYENLGRERQHFREEHPHVILDLDFDAMTRDDRSHAANILRRGLDLLSHCDETAHPEQTVRKDPKRERPTSSKSGPGARLGKSHRAPGRP